VDLVRTHVSEERISSIIREKIFSRLADSFHLDEREDTLLLNVGSYKSHTV
jgi:hypothetical protein